MKYIPQLDGLRACAILGVFLYHSPLHFKGGWAGVDLFFVLSGFLITRILVSHREMPIKQYFGTFYMRRARRILPPYIALMVIASVLFGFSWVPSWYTYIGAMNFPRTGPHELSMLWSLAVEEQFYLFWPFVVLFGFSWVPSWYTYIGAMNFPRTGPHELSMLWSLAVEEQFYLFWPFVVLFVPRGRLLWVAVCLILIAPLLRAIATPLLTDHWAIYKQTPFRMDCLATGALIGIIWDSHAAKIRRIGAYWLLPAVMGFITLVYLSRKGGFSTGDFTIRGNVITYELNLLIVSSVFLWALSDRLTLPLKLPVVRWIGRISYSIYLIHITAYTLVRHLVHGPIVVTLAAGALCVAYAAISFHFMESPLTGNRKRAVVQEVYASH
jgi:peptidoglycan/LPS O-acetylase OafA/YrhL